MLDKQYLCPKSISKALSELSHSIDSELSDIKREAKQTSLIDVAKEVEYFDTIKLVKRCLNVCRNNGRLEKKRELINQMASEVCVPYDLESKVSPEDFFKDIGKYLKQ